MRPLTDNERFAPTQPLPEYQARLRKQRRWLRPVYTPNIVPLGSRLLYGLVSLTWVGWAMIGLLSGHMFFIVSRRGPIHFSGVPAMLFSAAVVSSAAACAVSIIDHYDKRDNEEAYRSARRRMWLAALALFCLSGVVGLAERIDLLPYTDGRLGLLSTEALRSLLASRGLDEMLAPHRAALNKWSVVLLLWFVAGMGLLKMLGLADRGAKPRLSVALFTVVFLVGPALSAFTLHLLAYFVAGAPSSRPYTDELLRARLAWMQSMLLVCVVMLVVLSVATCAIVLRAVWTWWNGPAQERDTD